MFKVKIKGKDETLYYTVYAIEREMVPSEYCRDIEVTKTEFLIYDSEKGFHWVDSCECEPV